MGTLWGPVAGAAVITLVQQLVSIYVERWQTLLGVVFVLVVLFGRGGVWRLVTVWLPDAFRAGGKALR
jgi:branched-chain amino acid transport system permease protein